MMLWSMVLAVAPLAQLAEPANFGFSSGSAVNSPAASAPDLTWTATVTNYLEEPAPPPPPPPPPAVAAPPAALGLSAPGQAAACENYVNNLYADAECKGDGGCRFCSCCASWKAHCALCKLHSTCDMYPHYAYFPKHHGYYYYRAYNAIVEQAQQQTVVRLGGDPRNSVSVHMLDNLFEGMPATAATSTQVRRQGTPLPMLEDLLDPSR